MSDCVIPCRAALSVQGLKSPALQAICPLSVHFQYLSAFLQGLSLFNHIGYIDIMFTRLTALYPADRALDTIIIVIQMVSSLART